MNNEVDGQEENKPTGQCFYCEAFLYDDPPTRCPQCEAQFSGWVVASTTIGDLLERAKKHNRRIIILFCSPDGTPDNEFKMVGADVEMMLEKTTKETT